MNRGRVQFLLSLPPRMAAEFSGLTNRTPPQWFATSDPPGSKVGSGGGTAHLLSEAWRTTRVRNGPTDGPGAADTPSFPEWLRQSRKLIIHGGGQSRRLPAYAPVGKILMPMPVFRWASGQRLDQTLLDVQIPDYERALNHAPANIVAMVTSGDVLLRFGALPPFPAVDVIGLGMWVTPEKARNHGVFFSPRSRPNELAFCLQKPAPEKLHELSGDYAALVDTGMWLFSERALQVLMRRCGWDENAAQFKNGQAGAYDLYTDFGAALGASPMQVDPEINALSCAVIPLPSAEFYHFGATRQMIDSVSALQNVELDERKLGLVGAKRLPDQHVLNARFSYPLRLGENHSLWIENSVVPATWSLCHNHVLTGIPENQWDLKLEPGVCLDFVPVGESARCIRVYGFDDVFNGKIDAAGTQWLGRSVAEWFHIRGLTDVLQSFAGTDIQSAPLFPVFAEGELPPRFIEWMFRAEPSNNAEFALMWRSARRLSAEQLGAEANLRRLFDQRLGLLRACIPRLLENFRWSVMFKLDLAVTARLVRPGAELTAIDVRAGDDPLHAVHDQMFRSAVLRGRNDPSWTEHEARAFRLLQETIVNESRTRGMLALPRCSVLEDQIVWARSPVRLDLAGGWSDTPPYCLEYGGKVLNVAVNLNGQPPIQVFARVSSHNDIIVRSIDLGVEQRIRSYAELDTFAQPGSEFALAKAALALAGFLPAFHAEAGAATLQEQLRQFGGGIELSMLSAVPKGSGLGTSSILAATLLAALSDLCGLKWDKATLFTRTLALEQLLTTGGGWQDQAGAIFRSIKLIETAPGLAQQPSVRYLPEHLLGHAYANRSILLYYTGITRLAKSILQEIVRGMFMNSPVHLRLVSEIAANAERAFAALQECSYEGLIETIRRSWELNQMLDAGTNPAGVQRIFDTCGPDLAAAKLLGAGGGGFLIMIAGDEAGAARIREKLTERPPNSRARFVDFAVSDTGLQLTRS